MQVGVVPDQYPEAVHQRVLFPLSSNPTSQLYVTMESKVVDWLGLLYITWPLDRPGTTPQFTAEGNKTFMHYRVSSRWRSPLINQFPPGKINMLRLPIPPSTWPPTSTLSHPPELKHDYELTVTCRVGKCPFAIRGSITRSFLMPHYVVAIVTLISG